MDNALVGSRELRASIDGFNTAFVYRCELCLDFVRDQEGRPQLRTLRLCTWEYTGWFHTISHRGRYFDAHGYVEMYTYLDDPDEDRTFERVHLPELFFQHVQKLNVSVDFFMLFHHSSSISKEK